MKQKVERSSLLHMYLFPVKTLRLIKVANSVSPIMQLNDKLPSEQETEQVQDTSGKKPNIFSTIF